MPWASARVAPDVLLRCLDGNVPAHSLILRLMSPVLDDLVQMAGWDEPDVPVARAEAPAGEQQRLGAASAGGGVLLLEVPDKAEDWRLVRCTGVRT